MTSARLRIPFVRVGSAHSEIAFDVLSGRAAALLFMLVSLIALFPLLWFSTLPLLDYPNHLARFLMLGMDEQTLRGLGFTVYKALQLNLAADLAVPPLARIFGVEQATRIYVVGCLAATCGAVVVLARLVHGRWTVASFACTLFVVSTWIMMGFLNFLGGVALALWSGVLLYVIRSRPLPLRVLVAAATMAACGVAHVASMIVLGTLVFAMALETVVLRQGRIRTEVLLVVCAAAAAAALYLMQPKHGDAGYWIGDNGLRWYLLNKINLLLSGFGLMWSRTDKLVAVVALVALAWLALRGRVSVALMPAFAALVLVVGLLLLPFGAGGGYFVDGRLGWPIALLTAASIRFERMTSRRMHWLAIAGLVIAVTARTAFVTQDWSQKVERVEQFRHLLTALPQGARIANLPSLWETYREGPWNETHLPTYAVLDRSAVASSVFARPVIFSSTVEWLPEYAATDLKIFMLEFVWHRRGWPHAAQVLQEHWDYAAGYGESELKQLGAGWRIAAREGPFVLFENVLRVRPRAMEPSTKEASGL